MTNVRISPAATPGVQVMDLVLAKIKTSLLAVFAELGIADLLADWDDTRAALILRNCRDAMVPGGRVLVVDAVIDESPSALYGKLLDIEMVVLSPHGKERTETEFRELFAQAGLRLEIIVDTSSPLKIIEALRRAQIEIPARRLPCLRSESFCSHFCWGSHLPATMPMHRIILLPLAALCR